MKKFTELVASNIIAQAVLSILFGLFLIIWPGTTLVILVYILAAGMALSGIASLISYARMNKKGQRNSAILITGLLFLVFALIMFLFPEAFASIFSILLGALLIVSGVANAVRGFSLRVFGGSAWVVMLAVGIIIALGGIIIIANPFDSTVTFVLVLGILLVAKGIIDLLTEFASSRAEKRNNKR